MKFAKNILAVIVFSAGLVSCGNDRDTLQDKYGNYPQDGVVRISTMAVSSFSRASMAYNGETLGLCLGYGAGDKYSTDFVCWNNVDGKWEASSQMLWKNATDAVHVYAYAPYQGSTADVENLPFTILSDQTQGIGVADLVYEHIPAFVPSADLDSNQALNIDFSHALVKLTLNLSFGDEFDGTGLAVEGVTLNRMAGGVNLNLATGEVSVLIADAPQDIQMHMIGSNKYEAIFYPSVGQLAGNRMISVFMSDKKIYQYTVPTTGIDFKAGKAYEMNLKVGKDKLAILNDLSIKDWDSAEDLTGGEAEMQ